MEVQLVESSGVQAANVLGAIRGSDPAVSDEVLIVSAHLDHVGSLPDGTVFPGANNDASGIAVLLETARLWHDAGYRPRRTVLFAAWNAAENRSLGSDTYVTRPAYPLRDTVALMQLDQVGAGAGYYIIVSGSETQEALVLAHLENAARQVEGRLTFEEYVAGSDHDAFHRLGVPAVLLSWEEPVNDYTPNDTPSSLDARKLGSTGKVVTLSLMTLAED
jgi:Zn-dependent M28 family amino/carboxypeptidase